MQRAEANKAATISSSTASTVAKGAGSRRALTRRTTPLCNYLSGTSHGDQEAEGEGEEEDSDKDDSLALFGGADGDNDDDDEEEEEEEEEEDSNSNSRRPSSGGFGAGARWLASLPHGRERRRLHDDITCTVVVLAADGETCVAPLSSGDKPFSPL